MFASFPPSRKKLNCSCKVQAWRDDSSFLVEKVGDGRSSSCTNQGSIAVPECYSGVLRFPVPLDKGNEGSGDKIGQESEGSGVEM